MSEWFCRPLLVKELRETVRWSPIGMVVVGLLCWQSIPDSIFVSYRSVAVQFVYTVGIGAALVALALGLLQSLGDTRADARGFLLHRPTSLRTIFAMKLLAGFVTYVICLAPPILLTGMRLAVLGPERMPVGPFDLLPLVIASLVIFLLHPAAMWTTYRTARWVGTRTLPLLFAGIGIMLAITFLLESRGWWLVIFFPLVVMVWYAVIVHASWHAFSHQTFLPSVASGESMSASRAIGLLVACVVLLTTIGVLSASTLFRRSPIDTVINVLAVEANGDLWEIQNTYRQGVLVVGKESKKLGRRVTIDQASKEEFELLPEDWEEASLVNLGAFGNSRWYDRFSYIGQTLIDDSTNEYYTLFVHQGQVLAYFQQGGIAYIIAPDGVFDSNDSPTSKFRDVTLLSQATNNLRLDRNPVLVASDGIFQVDFTRRSVNRLIESEIGAAALELLETRDGAVSLWVMTRNQLSQYDIKSTVADEPLESATDPIIVKTQRYPLPLLEAKKIQEFTVAAVDLPLFSTVVPINASKIVLIHRTDAFRYQIEVLDVEEGNSKSGIVRVQRTSQSQTIEPELYFFPPGVVAIGSAVAFLLSDADQWNEAISAIPRVFIVALTMHVVVSAIAAFWMSRRRGVSRNCQTLWTVIGAIFGVAALPAIVAIHSKLIYEPCTDCDRPRRIDTTTCEHCNAQWDRLPQEGNEVIGGRMPRNLNQPAPICD